MALPDYDTRTHFREPEPSDRALTTRETAGCITLLVFLVLGAGAVIARMLQMAEQVRP